MIYFVGIETFPQGVRTINPLTKEVLRIIVLPMLHGYYNIKCWKLDKQQNQ
jgi:hypothetical protein